MLTDCSLHRLLLLIGVVSISNNNRYYYYQSMSDCGCLVWSKSTRGSKETFVLAEGHSYSSASFIIYFEEIYPSRLLTLCAQIYQIYLYAWWFCYPNIAATRMPQFHHFGIKMVCLCTIDAGCITCCDSVSDGRVIRHVSHDMNTKFTWFQSLWFLLVGLPGKCSISKECSWTSTLKDKLTLHVSGIHTDMLWNSYKNVVYRMQLIFEHRSGDYIEPHIQILINTDHYY